MNDNLSVSGKNEYFYYYNWFEIALFLKSRILTKI